MECKKETNLKKCNCTYFPCSHKGICCECISYHLQMRELPACVFPEDAEATFMPKRHLTVHLNTLHA